MHNVPQPVEPHYTFHNVKEVENLVRWAMAISRLSNEENEHGKPGKLKAASKRATWCHAPMSERERTRYNQG